MLAVQHERVTVEEDQELRDVDELTEVAVVVAEVLAPRTYQRVLGKDGTEQEHSTLEARILQAVLD